MQLPEERLLHTLCATLLSEVRSDQLDLSMRQFAIVLTVYRTNELQTVRGLAAFLGISRPAVCRALDRLEASNLAHRTADTRDRRSVVIMRTEAGAAMMQRLADAIVEAEFRWDKVPSR